MAAKRLVLASKNTGKLRELQAMLAGSGIEVVGLDSAAPDVEETGETFQENALLKARAAARATGLPALGEDAGLVVDALGGEPGVYSHRWMPGTDEDRYRALLKRMEGIPAGRRTARFVSCIAIVTPQGREEVVMGTLEGEIGFAPRGTGGFGYDPIFVLPDGRTLAELTLAEKNAVSHRAKSLARALPLLPGLLEGTD